ncbi:MAG: Uma2 family endonuclease [Anaerolineae bacterium]|nr:Uma2 family endonuclease [Anaerolineae bacterium]
MAVQKIAMTETDFEQFVALPENAERLFEFIGGEIVEVVSNGYSSEIGARMIFQLSLFVLPRGLGRITGADGGYRISGERYMPDAAFISKTKQPEPFRGAWNPTPPDLAVEVLSPSNTDAEMRIKIVNYLQVGTVVWVINPDARRVEVYAPGQPPRIVGIDGTLDGGDVLPEFALAVKEIFAE